jgi:hypothetical protein
MKNPTKNDGVRQQSDPAKRRVSRLGSTFRALGERAALQGRERIRKKSFHAAAGPRAAQRSALTEILS